jgi:hypothetical protein
MTTTTKRKVPAKRASRDAAVDRLESSLDAAQAATKSLREDLGSGGHDLIKTVETTIASARKDAARLGKAVRSDVADLQKAIVDPPARKHTSARKRPAARKAKAKSP